MHAPLSRLLSALVAALLPVGATGAGAMPGTDPPSVRAPSVLVHAPRSSADVWGGWVDLRYLRELGEHGIDVDYTDSHEDFTWERVRNHDVLVLFVCPLESGSYYDNTPDRPPYRDAFTGIVERFLESGGGVFVMARSLNADESFLPLLRRWGARIPYEKIEDADSDHFAPVPRMRGIERLWFTDNVVPGPVTDGVEQVWLPLTPHYSAAETMPIAVSRDWQVVLRGPPSSRTTPIDPAAERMLPPPEPLVRDGGVREPDLFAIREYGAGRIAFCAVWPQYSIGQGTEWLYDRRVLSLGVGGHHSDFGRLIENTLRWLAVPGIARNTRTPPVVDPARHVEPNDRPGVRDRFVLRSIPVRRGDVELLERARSAGRLHRGVIGVQTNLGSGGASVADYAAVARAEGLDFVVFLDDFTALSPQRLERLKADCREHAGPDLALYPGYRIETNTDNRMFLFGPGVQSPPPDLVVGGRLNLQYQEPSTGEYATRSVYIDWLNHRLLAGGAVNAGYFGWQDRPLAPAMPDLRLYSVAGLVLYREGERVEENLDAYLATAAGTIPPSPVSVHLVSSPSRLRSSVRAGDGLTYARARSTADLWSALGYAGQYEAPNLFASDGPTIDSWPAVRQYYTFAGEDYVPAAAVAPAPLIVRSDAGLREVRIYDGDRLFRRFLPGGARSFEQVLELSAAVQRTLVVVAVDVDGGRAVSAARRSWKGGDLAPVFCGDRVNHCDGFPLIAKAPGIVQVSRTPPILAGRTWDGGPRGVRPILGFVDAGRPILDSDRGREGDSGFAAVSRLEVADEGVVRVTADLDRLYDDRVPVVNPWNTYGPLGGPTRRFTARVSFTAFDRPTNGPQPNGYPGFSKKAGAELSLYENEIVFRRKMRVRSLRLFRQDWYAGPFPVTLVHGRGPEILATYTWSPGTVLPSRPRIPTGDWFAVHAPEPSNLSVHVNRGDPLRLEFRGGERLGITVDADLDGVRARPGRKRRYELLSVVDPLDAAQRGPERILEIVRGLTDPPGIRATRGRVVSGSADGTGQLGLLELKAGNGAAGVRVEASDWPAGVPLAVRIEGLNPRWTAGVFLHEGRVFGAYGPGVKRYREAGFDDAGRVHATLFPDLAETTDVVIGHPVVADADALFIQVTPCGDPGETPVWSVTANNPTDKEIRTVLRRGVAWPGLESGEWVVTIPPGSQRGAKLVGGRWQATDQ